jgi:hypothetical protein
MNRLAKKAPKTKSTTLVEVQKAIAKLRDDIGRLTKEREEERAAELRRDEALEEVIKQGTKAMPTVEGPSKAVEGPSKAAKARR